MTRIVILGVIASCIRDGAGIRYALSICMRNLNLVKVSDQIEALTGEGLEYLTDSEGNVIAKFIDGNLFNAKVVGNTEVTVTAA